MSALNLESIYESIIVDVVSEVDFMMSIRMWNVAVKLILSILQ